MTRLERAANFDRANPPAAPSAPRIKTLILLAALFAYAAGFVVLCPLVARSVATSVAEDNDPALMQFVGP